MTASLIGIDLSPTRLVAAALRERSLDEPLVQPTDCSDTGALVDQVAAAVEQVAAAELEAVGIAVPRVVEFATGRVVRSGRPSPAGNGAVELPLVDVPLRELLGDRLGVPVLVDHAAHVAALAEAHDAELNLVTPHLVALMIGANVAGGLVLDGRIYRGATGAAGELGHTIVGLDLAGAVPAPMRFPQPGSLEFVASGHALGGLAAQARNVHPSSQLASLRAQGKPVLGGDVIRAARDGDPSAARMVELWGQRIGIGVANAINLFDPEEVVIGGEAATAGDLLLEAARRVALDYVPRGLGARTVIRLTRHGTRAIALGAALMARYDGV